MPFDSKLTKEVRLSFRDQLREARFKAQKDAEDFEEIVFVLERIGSFLLGSIAGLGRYARSIVAVTCDSALSSDVPDAWRDLHTPFAKLYDLVRQARNDAMHEGAAARHATTHAIELSLVLENALMNGYDKVGDFMVRNPVCAEMWQPLSFIRQTMLVNSFSWLPVKTRGDFRSAWQLVSDNQVAQYLRLRSNGVPSRDLLVQQLEEAMKLDGIKLIQARMCRATDAVKTLLGGWDGQPVLVTREKADELLGILTPHDLL